MNQSSHEHKQQQQQHNDEYEQKTLLATDISEKVFAGAENSIVFLPQTNKSKFTCYKTIVIVLFTPSF